jgi:hypothetical protein
MVGAPPQPVDQRKVNDKMEGHFRKLEGLYSPELIQVVRWCLMIDPLQRPQSVFAVQRALMEPVQEEEVSVRDMVTRKIRNVFFTHIQFRRKVESNPDTTIQENTQ